MFLPENTPYISTFIYAFCRLVINSLVFLKDCYILVDILLQNVKRNLEFMVH